MTLPIQTSADDAIQVCKYLRTKPTGATIQDVKAIVGSSFADRRKIPGYEAWGLVERNGDSLAVSPLGRQLGQATTDALVREAFAAVLVKLGPYQKALEYVRSQGLESLSGVDLGAWWHAHMPSELGVTTDKSIISAVNSFFSVAEAAGVGTFKLGRRGAASRLESINIQRAAEILDGTLAVDVRSGTPEVGGDEESLVIETGVTGESLLGGAGHARTDGAVERVFIAHGKNMEIVQQIAEIVMASGLQPEVAEAEETTAIPVPDKVFSAMHRCQAAIICVTAEVVHEGGDRINQNVLIEIGAAFVLYEKQVILVWDKSLPVPSNLQGLYRCELEGNRLSWDEGVKLLRAIGKFKADPQGDL